MNVTQLYYLVYDYCKVKNEQITEFFCGTWLLAMLASTACVNTHVRINTHISHDW